MKKHKIVWIIIILIILLVILLAAQPLAYRPKPTPIGPPYQFTPTPGYQIPPPMMIRYD